MELSVCIITRNEENKIEKCLQMLAGYGWEIVVVDTGSTDRTKEIAQEYTTAVYSYEWCDDFAAAKNYAIGKASYDLVIVIDSDEYVEYVDIEALEQLAGAYPDKVGRINRRNQFTRDGEDNENQEYINRIFDRREYCYQGRIHEQVVRRDGTEYQTYCAPVSIRHDGYSGTQQERQEKARRNIRLLQMELEQEPDDTYLLYQLGKSYYMAGDYQQAVTYFSHALEYDVNPKLEYVIDMVETYGYALLKTGEVKTALQYEGIYEEFGGTADFQFLMGLIYMNNEMFDAAVEEFVKATKHDTARTTGVNSYLAYYNAGVIRECLGDMEGALEFYRKCGDYSKALERMQR